MKKGLFINNELEKLFDTWVQKQIKNDCEYGSVSSVPENKTFIRDGLINPEMWDFGPKVLYISREADVCERAGCKSGAVTECKFCLKEAFNGNTKLIKDEFYNTLQLLHNHIFGRYNIGDAAFMNISKRIGKYPSDEADLKSYAKEYSSLIRRQIEIIDPSFIVCLGTFDILNDVVFEGYDFIKTDQNEYLYHLKLPYYNFMVLDMYHPSNITCVESGINSCYNKRFSNITYRQ